ncbi:MAG: hypothetical protein ACOY4F_09460 [Thermodesulfobacteriota bacterium]
MSTEDAILELTYLSTALCALGRISAYYAWEPGETGNDTLAGVAHLVTLAGDRAYKLVDEIEQEEARRRKGGNATGQDGDDTAKRPRKLRPVPPAPSQDHAQESPS